MSNQASNAQIVAYLADVKRLLSAGKYDFVPRRKNMQALARHGLTIADAKNEILGLVVGDYYKGPKQDHDLIVREIFGSSKRILKGCNFT